MSDLFEYNPIEDVDREFMDYVGVHPLSWYDCKEPTAAFVELKYTTEMFDELLAACEAQSRLIEAYKQIGVAYRMGQQPKEKTLKVMDSRQGIEEQVKKAIAKAKGESGDG